MSTFVPYDDARSLLLAANLIPPDNIHFANEPFVQPTDAIWMSVDAYSDQLDMIDLGAGHWQEKGRIIIYLFAPDQTGTDTLRQLAKQVCNVFRGLPPRNPYYHNASVGSGGQSDLGNFWCLPVSVSFIFED